MGLALALSCGQQKESGSQNAVISADPSAKPAMAVEKNDELEKLAENKSDPVCKMPVTAGVSDTLSYDGHVIGFCSPECREEFAKSPKDFALEFKK